MIDWDKLLVEKTGTYSRLEVAKDQAEMDGCDIVKPGQGDLFLDIDSVESLEAALGVINTKTARDHLLIQRVLFTVSKSRRLHLYVETSSVFTDLERIGLQLLMGSDPKREALSFLRVTNEMEFPTLFFEKYKTQKHKAWICTDLGPCKIDWPRDPNEADLPEVYPSEQSQWVKLKALPRNLPPGEYTAKIESAKQGADGRPELTARFVGPATPTIRHDMVEIGKKKKGRRGAYNKKYKPKERK